VAEAIRNTHEVNLAGEMEELNVIFTKVVLPIRDSPV
jgi:hypothetical protein